MKNEEIKYRKQSENSIFRNLLIRENPDDAFDNAIKRGMKKPENWMYMYSGNNRDYFKHAITRDYISFPQFGKIEEIKRKLKNYKER